MLKATSDQDVSLQAMTTAAALMTVAMKSATDLVVASSEPMQHSKAVLLLVSDIQSQAGQHSKAVLNSQEGAKAELDAIKANSKTLAGQVAELKVMLQSISVFVNECNLENLQRRRRWVSGCTKAAQIFEQIFH